jgi:hypothetical protein
VPVMSPPSSDEHAPNSAADAKRIVRNTMRMWALQSGFQA